MTRRRWYAAATIFVLTPLLMAALPSSIENEIRSWFSSSGAAAVVLKARVCPRPRPNTTILCHEQSTNTLKLSVNGGLFSLAQSSGALGTVLVADSQGGWLDSGCSVGDIGEGEDVTLTCGRFASRDQNFAIPGRPNVAVLLGNENNSVANATCALSGQEGNLVELDSNNANGSQDFLACLGTAEVNRLTNPNFMLVPNSTGFDAGSTSTALGSANQVRCVPFVAPYTLTGATKMAFLRATADTGDNETVFNTCLYDSDKAILMATSSCIGGANTGVPCTVDSECPASTCGSGSTLSTDPVLQSKTGLRSTQIVQNRLYFLCYTGNSTTAQIQAMSNSTTAENLLNAYVTRTGTAANTASGRCPLTLGVISDADSKIPSVLVSAE